MLKALLSSLRIKQWIKNFFVFIPLIFVKEFTDIGKVELTMMVFGIFCAVASGIYLLNDIFDRKRDALHPTKKHRAIASGKLPVSIAAITSFILLGGGISAAFVLNPAVGGILLGYALLQISYSLLLKHLVIIDLLVISVGFVLRVFAGGLVIAVAISNWLLLVTFLLALLLATGKRIRETKTAGSASRKVLENYTVSFLDSVTKIILPCVLLAYLFYTFQANQSPYFIFTTPIVVYGLLRYLMLIDGENAAESPTELLLTDKPLLASVILWGISVIVILSLAGEIS
ncbi:MAG: decaprenyl-phosphate phosphoribosyltransferase [Candidatus Gracilibacteria bacterium]|nr:decaprenyl-phosphate phosphoribosyltransferase [Candidatus Gracilibacteria bacterium]MDD5178904.1 decaprenyl-phosphate phosphoribosyltransferase [Candidatus Gracilibacteria bacterium]